MQKMAEGVRFISSQVFITTKDFAIELRFISSRAISYFHPFKCVGSRASKEFNFTYVEQLVYLLAIAAPYLLWVRLYLTKILIYLVR